MPKVLGYTIALHSFSPSKNDELGLIPGDVVEVTKKADDGWWYGHKIQPPSEQNGWFPSNFTSEAIEFDCSQKGVLRYCRVDFEYKKQEEDELNLKVGDIITIINTKEDSGWYRGVLSGKVGLFPANFVTLISKSEMDSAQQKQQQQQPQQQQQQKNLNSLTPNERRTSLSPQKFEQLQKMEQQQQQQQKPNNFQPPPIQMNNKPNLKKDVLCRVVVTFDYKAQQPDELTLFKGEKLDVVLKEEEGWWTGIKDSGEKGLFPYNFVSILPAEQPEPLKGKPLAFQKSALVSLENNQSLKKAPPIIAEKPQLNKLPIQMKPQLQSTPSSSSNSSQKDLTNLTKTASREKIGPALPNAPKPFKPQTSQASMPPENVKEEPQTSETPKLEHMTKHRPSFSGRRSQSTNPLKKNTNEDEEIEETLYEKPKKRDFKDLNDLYEQIQQDLNALREDFDRKIKEEVRKRESLEQRLKDLAL